jgi:hypothetical protein
MLTMTLQRTTERQAMGCRSSAPSLTSQCSSQSMANSSYRLLQIFSVSRDALKCGSLTLDNVNVKWLLQYKSLKFRGVKFIKIKKSLPLVTGRGGL